MTTFDKTHLPRFLGILNLIEKRGIIASSQQLLNITENKELQ